MKRQTVFEEISYRQGVMDGISDAMSEIQAMPAESWEHTRCARRAVDRMMQRLEGSMKHLLAEVREKPEAPRD